MLFHFCKCHCSNHVSGGVEPGYLTGIITIEMHQELTFTQIADEPVGKGGL